MPYSQLNQAFDLEQTHRYLWHSAHVGTFVLFLLRTRYNICGIQGWV